MIKYNMEQLRGIARQWSDSIFNYFDKNIDNDDQTIIPWEEYENTNDIRNNKQ